MIRKSTRRFSLATNAKRLRGSSAIKNLERPRRRQHRIGMAIDLHMPPDLRDHAVGADQHRGSKNPKEGPAVHGFFAPSPIRLQHLMLCIRDQRNPKLVLVAKALLCAKAVGG